LEGREREERKKGEGVAEGCPHGRKGKREEKKANIVQAQRGTTEAINTKRGKGKRKRGEEIFASKHKEKKEKRGGRRKFPQITEKGRLNAP